ncbi:putative C-type lectin domain family 20 member A [Puntigrus tetrazona]|uniref:putative C-type lectin domain family 20 member A n=1 Tax=Puntigrus tetrazona TaxID=1606681 RepID=UPI001C8A50C4|nr:putative C-type lectin domain family 20 member A [Puntigrus tetrazona]
MDNIFLHLLFFAGLQSLTLCVQPEYILIKQLKTWSAAQNYCRTNHLDLATVQSNENWTRLQEAAREQSFSEFAWFGLYNDINGWRWSYNEESLVFKSWAVGQPDNYGAGEECVGIFNTGAWWDLACTDFRYFVCYDGSANATEKLVLSKTQKPWADAQKYCRDHYTDLVTIRSQADQNNITSLIKILSPAVWIGLYRETWKWSDQSNVTSSTQRDIQGFTRGNENCAGLNIYYRSVDDRYCTWEYYFYCTTVRKNRKVIRVQVKGAENMDEAKLKTLVLNKLQQTLRDEDVSVMWRTQPNGKVFQEINTVQKRKEVNTTAVCSWLE